MNPESQLPHPSPESDRGFGVSPQSVLPQSGGGVSPQAVPGVSRSDSASPFLHPPTHSHPSFDDTGFVYPPEMPAEPDYDGDFDYEESARERELILDDLADDNEDFTRSNDEGWFYSDED
jgi:hypothetical protein